MLAASELRVFTTEYPPYASANLPEGGAAVRMLRDILAPQGYRLRIDFLPWARLTAELGLGRYDLVLLAWPGDLIQHGLLPSSPWFISRLGFFVRQEQLRPHGPSLDELAGQRVGIVRDYAYPPQLLNSRLRLELANSDAQNLRKLAARRFDYVVLERAVGHFLLAREPLAGGREPLVWQEPAFAELPIHVGVVPGRTGSRALLQALDSGLMLYRRDGRYRLLLKQHRLDGVAEPGNAAPLLSP